jgi:hypothetical protein
MNLLCPNCQKNITVPDQYAGQVMKCPLCGGTFKAPSLPQAATAPAAPPPAAPIPPASAPGIASGLQPPSTPVVSPAPPPPPEDAVYTLTPAPEPPPAAVEDHAAEKAFTAAPAPSQTGRRRGVSIPLDVRVIRWLPPLALLAVFVLLAFPWVGLYPGGEAVYTQNGWQAMFGLTPAADMDFFERLIDVKKSDLEVGVSWPLILYFVVLVPTLGLAFVTAGATLAPLKLPPLVQQILSWKAAVLGAAALLALLLFLLEMAISFPLETKAMDLAEKKIKDETPKLAADLKYKEPLVQQRLDAWGLRTTFWHRLAVLFNMAAVFFLLVELWLTRRGETRRPRLEIGWSDGEPD